MKLTPAQVLAFRVNAEINKGFNFMESVEKIAIADDLSVEYVKNCALGYVE